MSDQPESQMEQEDTQEVPKEDVNQENAPLTSIPDPHWAGL